MHCTKLKKQTFYQLRNQIRLIFQTEQTTPPYLNVVCANDNNSKSPCGKKSLNYQIQTVGKSEERRQPATEKPTSKKTFTKPQASDNKYHFTRTHSQHGRGQNNTSTEERTGMPATTEAEN